METGNFKIGEILGQDIYEGATIKVQYFDGQFAYGSPKVTVKNQCPAIAENRLLAAVR